MITPKPFTFTAPARDLDGRTVALVARRFDGPPLPPDAFVVHLNKALGWGCAPRADELFTIINDDLLARAGDEFRDAATAARVIRVRSHSYPSAALDRLAPGLAAKCAPVSALPCRDSRDLAFALTSGVFAAHFYEARGARVLLCGFSADRSGVSGYSYHRAAAPYEADFIASRTAFPPIPEHDLR